MTFRSSISCSTLGCMCSWKGYSFLINFIIQIFAVEESEETTIILAYISNIILVYVNWIYVTLFTITSSFLSILLITALWILLYGCVCVINIITLSSVRNVYLFVWTMDHVLFGVYLKFTCGVSTCT